MACKVACVLQAGLSASIVIDDTNNANLKFRMKRRFRCIGPQQSKTTQKLVFVMGDMAELGTKRRACMLHNWSYAKQKAVQIYLVWRFKPV